MRKQAVEVHFKNSARKGLEIIDFIFVNHFIALFFFS